VVNDNVGGRIFWRKVLGAYVPTAFDEIELEGEMQFRFENPRRI
jgi:hypothetical protein